MCLKEKVVVALNETIQDDRPIVIGFLEIQKNPIYFANKIDNNVTDGTKLPATATERGLGDTLMDKLTEFFKSRTLKVNLSNAFEGKPNGIQNFCFFMQNFYLLLTRLSTWETTQN